MHCKALVFSWCGYYPTSVRSGNVIGLSVRLLLPQKSPDLDWDLGIWATPKRIQSVRISEKLAWMYFELFITVHERHK